ncbi:MAG: hypothetical protein ACFE8J_05520, partial [Candidatus Heimdallarchaeota archaeon]
TFFTVLFLPFYPLFFIIFKDKSFNFLEKLSLTIFSNLAFYIILAYLMNSFKIAITGSLFFVSTLVIYFSLISFVIICELVKDSFTLIKPIRSSTNDKDFLRDFSILKYLKSKIPINNLLIVFILVLLAILNGVRFSYFYGTDAMYHVFIIKLITNLNFLPTEQYFGAVGLHIFGSVINFFSDVDLLYLAKYFSFYTFFVSALLIYNLLMRIFKKRNLAILGVFILEMTSLGFSNMMYQFWPTGLATIQSLFVFFLLYIRLQNLIKVDKPSKKEILGNLFFSYILIVIISISAILTHSLITMIFILSFGFIFLIFFLRDYRRGIDFLVIAIVGVIFLLLYFFSDISEHWYSVDILKIPWYVYLIGGIGGSLIIWKFRNSVDFKTGRFESAINGLRYKYYKKIEDKIIFRLFYSILIIFSVGFLLINFFFLDLIFSKLLIALECFIVIFFGIWGLIIFQKKPSGKPFLLWLAGILLIFFVAFIIDFFEGYFYSGRILLLFAPLLIIGFVSYIYKLLNKKLVKFNRVKIVTFMTILFMLFAQFSDQLLDIDDIEYSLHRREVTAVKWYSNFTFENNLIICEFGIPYVLYYYDYPFEMNNKSLTYYDLYEVIMKPRGYFKPADHFYENGTNKLQDMKKRISRNIYLILDDNYLAFSGFEVYERLTKEEMNQYYNMIYLNRVFISKSETGIEVPFYWVI